MRLLGQNYLLYNQQYYRRGCALTSFEHDSDAVGAEVHKQHWGISLNMKIFHIKSYSWLSPLVQILADIPRCSIGSYWSVTVEIFSAKWSAFKSYPGPVLQNINMRTAPKTTVKIKNCARSSEWPSCLCIFGMETSPGVGPENDWPQGERPPARYCSPQHNCEDMLYWEVGCHSVIHYNLSLN